MEKLPKINQATLLSQIGEGKYMLFFSADWCSDCNFIKPRMPEIEAEYPEYTFLAVDRDENIDLAVELDVFGIPSFIAFENGKELGRFVNKDRKTKDQVEEFINNL
ncbi:Thiol-disulfide isomerase and thioredoxin [Paucilactobacillus oligofermentans DSM 15707 = LMG 22743]|uniref:Thiol-disulfide isomerase and thioredoxin n=1 Tax=Paucilactobacillus oligofermentans DSM 15707 = LMG 22743 TaxID=1423778 RepID=A0A0R1RGH6_9LACO|nr:thioredoxin family protein [Paucilactobacillus oligofermentans]KRL55975.1 Thiol-disulfide isomerase and thioredoxin [Paucilactobacillus oligofermentans DSM 15707 = LMG 22743]CUS26043.1 Thioredoxin-like protein [Paucilactobacillus oligofermentans DSM 15707 = LMG 22743]